MSRLGGRRILLTGAGGAIGRAIAIELASQGAALVLVGRTAATLADTLAELPEGDHAVLPLDVGEQADWAANAGALEGITDVVAAAAVLNPVGPIGTYDPAEFWSTMQINVLGTLLAVHSTLESVRAARGSIVVFSGGGATKPLRRYDAYATSKAATVRLAENLAVELEADGVRVNAIAPGFVASAMHEVTLQAGAAAAGDDYFASTQRSLDAGGVPPQRSAELISLLIDPAGPPVTGRLISAEWDPWDDPAFFDSMAASPDLGRLRRVDDVFITAVPERS
jgi:NAD(P)-dependent dehydrogenase (short-subunit alcohol dehydrogenase family)